MFEYIETVISVSVSGCCEGLDWPVASPSDDAIKCYIQ
jgi:hypothetical protein